MKSDHTGLGLDFNMKILFNRVPDDITKPSSRKLKMNSPQSIEKYVDYLENQFAIQNIAKRVKDIEGSFLLNLKIATEKYEVLSIPITKLQLRAEQKCLENGGSSPYSPTLANAIIEMRTWKLILYKHKKKPKCKFKVSNDRFRNGRRHSHSHNKKSV